MITVKKDAIERIKSWDNDTIYVLTDFDHTMTTEFSSSSWGILSKSNIIAPQYVEESQELFNYYASFEIDESLDYETKNKFMIEWWNKHINLLVKYKVSEEIIDDAVKDDSVMLFRDGAKDFLKDMKKRNIPVVIISAGIGNFIEKFLIKNNCYYDNIFIVSNFIKFKNGVAVGIKGEVIHSLNKSEASLPNEVKEFIKNRHNIILFGDLVADIRMIKESERENALKIGFLEEDIEANKLYFEKEFDVVCTDNTSYYDLKEELSILGE